MTNKHQLIKADTVYGLIQSVNDILRDRFTSRGRTLDDNSWRACPVANLEEGFWKAVRDGDFGSVLTYSTMLAGRGTNVASLIFNAMDAYGEQVNHLHEKEVTRLDTIRLQRTTIEQHEKTIADLRAKLGEKTISDLRAKLDEKGTPEPYRTELVSGIALESERVPELCYSVEAVCDNTVETLTIQGDPAAVKDLVMVIRAEQTACTGPSGGVNVASEIAAAVAEAYKQVW